MLLHNIVMPLAAFAAALPARANSMRLMHRCGAQMRSLDASQTMAAHRANAQMPVCGAGALLPDALAALVAQAQATMMRCLQIDRLG